MVAIQPQGLHYNAPHNDGERTHSPALTTCSQKPHHHAGVKYDKIPAKSTHAGELGLTTASHEDAGWFLRAQDGSWQRFSTEKVKMRLRAMGNTKPEVELILGSTIGKAWKLVNIPFQPEYPGDRQWNVNAAQYVYPPANLEYDEVPQHPHWARS
jgi:hypothetical protein